MARYLGDFLRTDNIQCWWNSYSSLGASLAPSAAGTAFVFKSGSSSSATQVGITLTATVLPGVNCITVSMGSTTSFFQPHNDYSIVISGYTVDSQFVSGCVGQFSVENRYEPGLIRRGTLQTASSSAVSLDANASSTSSFYDGCFLLISDFTGLLQGRVGTSYAAATKTLSVDRAFAVTPTVSQFRLYAGSLPTQDTELGTALWASYTTRTLTGTSTATITRVTTVDSVSTVSNLGANAIGTTALAASSINAASIASFAIKETSIDTIAISNRVMGTGAISAAKIADGAITNAAIASNAIANANLAVGSIDSTKVTADFYNEGADKFLSRGHDATSKTTRRVQDGFAALLNKVDASGSVGTVYQRDDATSAWTFSTSTGGFPINKFDPAP